MKYVTSESGDPVYVVKTNADTGAKELVLADLIDGTPTEGLQGERGIPGEIGPDGTDGTPGADGADGAKGDAGDAGAKGDKGDTGLTGAKGDKGDKGDTGDAGANGTGGAIVVTALPALVSVIYGQLYLLRAAGQPDYFWYKARLADGADHWVQSYPIGGTTGQVLAKGSGADYDINWVTLPTTVGDAVPSVSIVSISRVATAFNFTTEGTIDWVGTPAVVARDGVGNSLLYPWRKTLGGYQIADLRVNAINSGGAATASFFGGQADPATVTVSDAQDKAIGAAGSTFSNHSGFFTNTGDGIGYIFSVPAGKTQRVLRIYTSSFHSPIKVLCRLSDGSVGDVVNTAQGSTTTQDYQLYTITYNASKDGQKLHVALFMNGPAGTGNPNVCMLGITLGWV